MFAVAVRTEEGAGGRRRLTDGVAALDGVGGVMQRGEARVGPAALELDEQGLLGRAGEVARALERAICAAHTFLLLWGQNKYQHAALVGHATSHSRGAHFANTHGTE